MNKKIINDNAFFIPCSLLTLFSLLLIPIFLLAEIPKYKSLPPAKVVVQTVQLTKSSKKIISPAKVEAKIQTTSTSDISGHVVEIVKTLGQKIKAGDVILYIENKDPVYTFAKVPVKSPINGVLSALLVNTMMKVERGDKLFTVIDPNSLHLIAEFSGRDLNLLKLGLRGEFLSSQLNENQISSLPIKLTAISPLIDPKTGTATAEMDFVNKKDLPTIGSISQVQFQISTGDKFLIPESSLDYIQGRPYIRVLNPNNEVKKVEVQLGENSNGLFEIRKGLSGNEQLIVRATRTVKEGEAVELENKN